MDNAEYEAARRSLEQIADALGIPVAAFLDQATEPSYPALAAEQEDELLRLFRGIHDAELRKRVLTCMRFVVNQSVA
ncbi:hypothetical protein MKK75_01930 [Methylobacterium sp. J-030]|uniref:hypothetical protein n=1 Tax=Methylobacterium sp. J-030 TaxID=2836627 RepID=UPI001FB86526|nr:hypothetical protein [Methylobacterium sp. J-030]MCJ2067572.1 hypothetical protein [Methylobacterium sp. J-030]